jgi:predicted MFS family arabinose efflux permease
MKAIESDHSEISVKVNKFVISLMAVAAGVIVANIYYNQPILNAMAQSVLTSEANAGKISMMSQLGYGVGMFFLLPLGDKLSRKNLIVCLCCLLFLSLVLLSFSRTIQELYFLSFIVGVCSSPAQIILPMAATLGKENRGKTVGRVFAGILVGILGARVFAGGIAGWLGWRAVFRISAVLVLGCTVLLRIYLPNIPPKFKGGYGSLLKSTLSLIVEYRVLRQAALLGAFTFGTFSSFWTTLTFHLGAAPLSYSPAKIGLFGLIAIGGALVAPWFGKLADKGDHFKSLLFTVGLIIASILLMKLFPLSVVALCVGIFFLDIGVQATQITNFTRIYSLHEHAHSRLNTIYMTTYFIGGATGTFFGVLAWHLGGWELSTWQMMLWGFIAVSIVWFSGRKAGEGDRVQESEHIQYQIRTVK